MSIFVKHVGLNTAWIRRRCLSPAFKRILKGVAGASVFAGLIAVGANIRIPLQPVPVTLQTLFVLLSGAILGRGYGPLSGTFYLLLGVFGLPVFAGSITGPAVLAGPTGGYLLGFIIAPFIIAYMILARRSSGWSYFSFFIGSLVILFCGLIHLTLFYTHNVSASLQVGFLPFLPGELLKIFAACSIYKSYVSIIRYRSSR